jgi:photosystem II stability/assembly factor-like uncharacterized protein
MERKMRTLKISLLVFILSISISAQEFWEQTNGPFGAFALSLASDSMGVIYTGTMTQGLYKSNNVGNTWTRIGLNGRIVNSILVFSNQIIFAATDEGLYQTYDGGNTWAKNNISYSANTLCKTRSGSILLGTNQQIYRSTDIGITWQNTTSNIPNVNISSICIDSTSYLFAAAGNKGILVSSDDGVSWILSNTGLPGYDYPVKVVFVKDDNNVFAFVGCTNYIYTLAGVYISTNHGASWNQRSGLLPISQFAISPNGFLLAGVHTDYSGYNPFSNGIYYSSDLGSSWTQLLNQNNFNVRALLTTSEGDIISGNYYSGIFISNDNGNSWVEKNTGINNSDITDVYATTAGTIFCSRFSLDYSHGGVYRSFDDGNSWEKLNTGTNNPNARAFFEDSQGNIYAGDNSLYRSSDNGENWQIVNSGMGLFYCFTQSPNGTIFTGTSDNGIFRSTDNGLTWNHSNTGLTILTIFTLTTTNLGTILAGSFEGNIFRSTNNGISWETINTLHNSTVLSLYTTNNNITYAGLNADFNNSILKSSDDGLSWEAVVSFPVRGAIVDINQNSIGDIFVASKYDGVYRSQDNGNSWLLISNEGISNLRIQTMSISMDGYIYIGTWRGSLFKSIHSTTNVESTNYLPKDFLLNQNYPNPFNPSTSMQYTIGSRQFVTLKVFDLLGREVAILVNEEKPAGEYEVEFNGVNLPSGIYFYQLNAEQYSETKKMVLLK